MVAGGQGLEYEGGRGEGERRKKGQEEMGNG